MNRAPRISPYVAHDLVADIYMAEWTSDVDLAKVIGCRQKGPKIPAKASETINDLGLYGLIQGKPNLRRLTSCALDLVLRPSTNGIARVAATPNFYRTIWKSMAINPSLDWRVEIVKGLNSSSSKATLNAFEKASLALKILGPDKVIDRNHLMEFVQSEFTVENFIDQRQDVENIEPTEVVRISPYNSFDQLFHSEPLGIEILNDNDAPDSGSIQALEIIITNDPTGCRPFLYRGWGLTIRAFRSLGTRDAECFFSIAKSIVEQKIREKDMSNRTERSFK